MDDLSVEFENRRTHLRAVAYRLLGSVHEADDAVQETWLRLQRSDVSQTGNLGGWLTTVVSRICLDQLRARASRREVLGGDAAAPDSLRDDRAVDPAAEAEHADTVGRALLVVLDTLPPAERLAFCLHDLFGLSFDEVSAVLGRSSVACRQLASRGRRRVRGRTDEVEADRVRHRDVVEAFMDASRNGRFERLLELLHPEAAVSSDAAAAAMGSPALVSGRDEVAGFFSGRARAARRAELDGFAAALWSLRGEIKVVFAFTVEDDLVREIELLAGDVDRLDVRTLPARRSAD
ncbi:sigma-70 family RNA polymerase sigma factor [Nakamurella endophytica]|uniref:DNA-directed RNA polymerase sigma-70 factor n=1 Tax=Nakamurella endophytica TaxID=1748367 RepID=A0A917WN19_9ACTN|nr:sigma-70 family RNA polymerase sigma factor [Nakamurella endophytica]GGM16423.1 DNA-directed RNA polymerase sigma-70 factor [Nakamurella endophytica]